MADKSDQKSPIMVTVPTTEVVTDLVRIDAHLAGLYRRAVGAEEPGTPVPVVRVSFRFPWSSTRPLNRKPKTRLSTSARSQAAIRAGP